MKIVAYLKPQCGWSQGVRAIMEKYHLDYVDLDIVNNSSLYVEMLEKSGQPLSPCVEINDIMLADVSGEEVEAYLLENKLVEPNNSIPNKPINKGCSHSREESSPAETVRFF